MIGKSWLPKSLFGRTLLILVLPMVLVQLIMAYIFYDRHWDNVARRMAIILANEIAFTVEEAKHAPEGFLPPSLARFTGTGDLRITLEDQLFKPSYADEDFPELQEQLRTHFKEPFEVRKIDRTALIDIRIAIQKHTLHIQAPLRRLESRTTVIYLWWMIGASLLFLMIAALFMRNQIRPIRKLAEAAENFGRGVDMVEFKPSGATEVRKASRAFIIMRERIKRQIRTRTDMLSGISHDLRTPLTRMKLQLAMLKDSQEIRELSDDVQQMEHMIQEYLDFACGEGREEAVKVNLRDLLDDVVSDYRRLHAPVMLSFAGEDMVMDLRMSGMRRMLHNIIDNALRYGKHCEISWRRAGNYCEILIDDDGPGIPPDKRDEVFKPFLRLDQSRNPKTGGVGLGLTIARDIAFAHGGSIMLDASSMGGLRVIVRVPL